MGLQGTGWGTAPGEVDVPTECKYKIQCGGWYHKRYSKLVRHRFQGSGTLKAGFLRNVKIWKQFKKGKIITHECNSMVKGKEMEMK